MIKKLIIPLVAILAGTSFVTYSFLDTFVVEKKYDTSVIDVQDAISNFSFSFAEMEEEEEEEYEEESSSEPIISVSEESSKPIESSLLEQSSSKQSISQESSSSNLQISEESSSTMSSSEESSNSSLKSETSQSSIEEPSSSETISSSSEQSSSSSVESSSSSSEIVSSSSSSSAPDVNISTNQYYENLTKAQISALFTKEVVFEPKKHYSDPYIYVDITTDRFEDYSTYYAADIRIKNVSYLRTALANDTPGENITEFTSEMCIRHKGVIAINGDTYGAQESGYVIRNGQKIRSTKNTSRKKPEDLAIYANGTFEIFNENDYTIDEIAAKGAWHVFSFGPGLISEGQKIIQKGEEVGTAAGRYMNQRCAIGMIAPLHYIFVVSDGRIKSSPGLSLYQIGKIMEAKHAYCAYNLDGGGSATMYMDDGTGNANGLGALVNYCTQQLVGNNYNNLPENPPIGERGVSDIVYIGKA